MKTWDLSILYSDIDAPELLEDVEKLKTAIDEKAALAEKAGELNGAALAEKYILASEKINDLASKLFIYANLRYSADTRDIKAASLM